ncbi:hypothetical protein FALB51S_02051 [Frigidibacter albus]
MQADGSDDDDVVAFQQRPGRRVAHPVDLLVDLQFLLDICIRPRHIGLGLVVVIVTDEVLDGILGEEALELAVKLRRQRLVRGQDDRRALRLLDDLRHCEGLAGARRPQQHLVALARPDALCQLRYGCRLVARRLERAVHDEAAPAFQLGAGQHVGAMHRHVHVVMGHGETCCCDRSNLICFCSGSSVDRPTTGVSRQELRASYQIALHFQYLGPAPDRECLAPHGG